MANEKNLRHINETFNKRVTSEEKSRAASKAGKASVEAKRKRKTFTEAYEYLVETVGYIPIGEMAEAISKRFPNLSWEEAMMMAQVVAASNGNTQAFVAVRDTVGEKPTEKQEVKMDATVQTVEEYLRQFDED